MSSAPDAAKPSPRDQTEAALVGLAIIVAGVALLIVQERWASNFQLIEHDRYFWMTMVVIFLGTIGVAEAAWHFVLRRSGKYSGILGLAATIATYHVFYPIANGALDRRPAERRLYVIERRYCYAAKSDGRAHIWLRSRATPDDEIEYRVSRRRCLDAKDGEELVLDVKPGFFGTAWVPRYEEEWW